MSRNYRWRAECFCASIPVSPSTVQLRCKVTIKDKACGTEMVYHPRLNLPALQTAVTAGDPDGADDPLMATRGLVASCQLDTNRQYIIGNVLYHEDRTWKHTVRIIIIIIIIITVGRALDRVHNSRRPAERHGAARLSHRDFLHFWLFECDPDLWPFDLIFNGGRGIVTDYQSPEFGDFSFSCFGYHAVRQNHRQRRMIAILTRLGLC